MTALHKRISRTTAIETRRGQNTEVVVTLYPGGLIGFRHKGRRTEYTLDLKSAYWFAAKAAAEERIIAKRAARKTKP